MDDVLDKVPESVWLEAYGDLLKPSFQQVGIALGGIAGFLNTLLLPVHLANGERNVLLEKTLVDYGEKMIQLPEEKVVEVHPEIGIPLLQKASYTRSDDLRELLAGLLASASNKDERDRAHPNFVNLIGRMSADEAKIIKYLGDDIDNDSNKNNIGIGFIFFRREDKKGGLHDLSPPLTGLEKKIDLFVSENIHLYMANLISLGIIEMRRDIVVNNSEVYDDLERVYSDHGGECKKIADSKESEFERVDGIYMVTLLGMNFIEACT